MKNRYIIFIVRHRYTIFIVVLGILAVCVVSYLYVSPIGENPKIQNIIQSIGLFIALIAAIIALAIADFARKVKMEVKVVRIKKEKDYKIFKDDLPDDLKASYKKASYEKFSDPLEFHLVYFKIINRSGFSLRKPVFTFEIPSGKTYIAKKEGKYQRTFHSSMWFIKEGFEFEHDRILLYNNIFPYFNDEQNLWIAMFLENMESFNVLLSLNCENADGITKKVNVDPKIAQ